MNLLYFIFYFCHVISFFPIFSIGSTCEILSNRSFCYPLLNYTSVSISSCQSDQEYTVTTIGVPLFQMLTPSCRDRIAYAMCSFLYPLCDSSNGSPIRLCQNDCLTLLNVNDSSTQFCNEEDQTNLALVNNSFYNLTCQPSSTTPTTSTSNCDAWSGTFNTFPRLPRCAKYNGTACGKEIDYEVFVPGYPIAEDWIDQMDTIVNSYSKLGSFINLECIAPLARLFCGAVIPKCNQTLLSTLLSRNMTLQPAFPIPPCYSVCTQYLSPCADLITLGAIQDSCETTHNLTYTMLNVPQYQCNNEDWRPYSLDYVNSTYTFVNFPLLAGNDNPLRDTCNLMESNQNRSRNETCVQPAVVPDNNNTIGVLRTAFPYSLCELPCPATYIWSDTEWNNAISLMYVNIPSFICSTFMLLTFTIFPNKRKQQFVLSFIFCIWIVSAVLVFGFASVATMPSHLQSLKYISCKDNSVGASMNEGSYCVFQAFILFEFLLCATCWWFLIALEVYFKVVREQKFTKEEEDKHKIMYHTFAWGYPTLSLIIFLAAGGKLGGSITSIFLFCFIYHETPPTNPWKIKPNDYFLDYIFWYGPIGLMGVIGAIIMGIAIAKIIKTTRRSKIFRHDDTATAISIHLRPLLFVLSFFMVFFWFFIWRIEYSLHESDFLRSMQKWINCQIQVVPTYCAPPQRLSSSTWYGIHFFLALQGILVTLTWGTQYDNFILWKEFLLTYLCCQTPNNDVLSHRSMGMELTVRPTGSPSVHNNPNLNSPTHTDERARSPSLPSVIPEPTNADSALKFNFSPLCNYPNNNTTEESQRGIVRDVSSPSFQHPVHPSSSEMIITPSQGEGADGLRDDPDDSMVGFISGSPSPLESPTRSPIGDGTGEGGDEEGIGGRERSEDGGTDGGGIYTQVGQNPYRSPRPEAENDNNFK